MDILLYDLKKVYKDKSDDYYDVLALVTSKKIDYIIFNFYQYMPEQNSGDIDIIIQEKDLNNIKNILFANGYNFYNSPNTKQEQWIKYKNKLGVCQFHIHVDLCFFDKYIVKFDSLDLFKITIEEEYILFLLQSFFKNKYNYKTVMKYKYFLNKCNFHEIKSLINNKYLKYKNIISISQDRIKNNPTKYDKIYWLYLLLKLGYFKGIVKVFVKKYIYKIAKRIGIVKNKDKLFIFIGVDGAGKSTSIKNIKKSLGNELYVKKVYFGLKNSLITKITYFLKLKKKYSIKKVSNNHNNIHKNESILVLAKNNIIGICFWIEYNLRYLFQIKLISSDIDTVWLIDRTYYDVLLYYDTLLIKKLFMKYSFHPNKIFFLTGNSQTLYLRKMEVDENIIDSNIKKYNNLINEIKNYNIIVKKIDTTVLIEEDTVNRICMEIMDK